jgi:hypothetical protein
MSTSHPIRTTESLEVQVHHLISLGGWNDVIYLSIYHQGKGCFPYSLQFASGCPHSRARRLKRGLTVRIQKPLMRTPPCTHVYKQGESLRTIRPRNQNGRLFEHKPYRGRRVNSGAPCLNVDNNHHVAGKDMCVGFLFQGLVNVLMTDTKPTAMGNV